MDGLIVWWSRQKKWWKAFYVTFVVMFLVFLLAVRTSPFAAFQWAALYAIMVGGAIWASEKLKERMRRRR